MLILSEEVVEQSASPRQWVDCMEEALRAVADSAYVTPDRMHVDINANTLLIMPSVGPELFATKLVSVFPGNTAYNIPSIQGTVLLNDGRTGEALALLNGSKLTAMRTAAVAAVGARHLAPPRVRSIGVVGAGVQGRHLAWLIGEEKAVDRVYVFDPAPEMVQAFGAFLADKCPQVDVVPCGSVEELCRHSEILITATTSKTPVLPAAEELLSGRTVIGVGSYRPDMREFPVALFDLCRTVWVDAEHGRRESGDLCQSLREGLIKERQVVPITQLLNGSALQDDRPTQLFKTVGLGVFDLFGAQLVYARALECKLGKRVDV